MVGVQHAKGKFDNKKITEIAQMKHRSGRS
jgi:hypothetical protein